VTVFNNLNGSISVNGHVVPGGHHLLGLVPGRRDVGVRPGKDGQGGLALRLPPLRIRPRHVSDQTAVRPRGPFEEKRQVAGEWQPIDLRDEEAEAVLLDEIVQPGQVGFGEGGGYVHRGASLVTGRRSAVCFLGWTRLPRRGFVSQSSR